VSLPEKYDRLSERWSERAYGDPQAYLRHRAELTLALGPPLAAGDTVLDLGCADAGVAEYLLPHGLRYLGIDGSPGMVEEAGRRFGDRVHVEVGDLNVYEPPAPVAATTCFRALYYADDLGAFLRRVAGYTTTKLVFDFSPRRIPLETVRAEVRAAGFARLECRPFLIPQSRALPRPVQALLRALESAGPLGRLLVRVRFSLICAASK
jgi:SAM-dependent methyltransferase